MPLIRGTENSQYQRRKTVAVSRGWSKVEGTTAVWWVQTFSLEDEKNSGVGGRGFYSCIIMWMWLMPLNCTRTWATGQTLCSLYFTTVYMCVCVCVNVKINSSIQLSIRWLICSLPCACLKFKFVMDFLKLENKAIAPSQNQDPNWLTCSGFLRDHFSDHRKWHL